MWHVNERVTSPADKPRGVGYVTVRGANGVEQAENAASCRPSRLAAWQILDSDRRSAEEALPQV